MYTERQKKLYTVWVFLRTQYIRFETTTENKQEFHLHNIFL